MGSWKKIKAKKRRRTDLNDQERIRQRINIGQARRYWAKSAFTKPCDSIMVDFFARSFPDEFGKRNGEIELI